MKLWYIINLNLVFLVINKSKIVAINSDFVTFSLSSNCLESRNLKSLLSSNKAMAKVKITEPLNFLNVLGLNPLNSTNFTQFRKFLSLGIFLTVIILAWLELLLNFEGLETYSRASEAMIVQYQV